MPDATTTPAGRVRKSWTVMVYMIADDPAGGQLLDQAAAKELDEIIYSTLGIRRKSEYADALHVAVQVDFRSQPDVWRRVVVQETWFQPESDASDPSTLYGFFAWVAERCPADHIS